MKILLINPNWALDKYKYTMAVLKPYKITPIELCYIAGGIDKKHTVEIYDASALQHSWIKIKEHIREVNPDVCVIPTAPNYLFWRCCPLEVSIPVKLIKIIRSISSAKNIVIGPHGTITPKYILNKTKCDFLIKGEADKVTSDIINSNFKNISQLPGVCSKSNISNSLAVVEKLDDLPIPKLNLLDLNLYESQIWLQSLKKKVDNLTGIAILAEASRGCPRHCVFCQRELFRDKYREKSEKRMKEELDYYKSLGVKFIYFIDETGSIISPAKEKWIKHLGRKGIKFGVEATIDQTTPKVVDLFKENGCIYLEFGLETIDKEILSKMSKNNNQNNLNYAKEQIKNIVCFELNFYTKDYIELLDIKSIKQEALFDRPIIPYPASILGKLLLIKYGIKEVDTWDFVLRYTW
jgi:hypothetical protein